jgi:hypothetical protein
VPGKPIVRPRHSRPSSSPRRIKILLVLDKWGRGVVCPRPGGEPLYKLAALSVNSRRLPGVTQRNVLPIASSLLRGYNGP